MLDPDHSKYVRTTHFVAPFWGLFPPPAGIGNMQAFVPVDDEHTYFMYIQYSLEGPLDKRKLQEIAGTVPGVGLDEHFRLRHGRHDNWGQNRAAMKSGRSFTGLSGINVQDFVVQESMGPIYDRRKEHLGVSDLAVIRMRRVLLDSLDRFERGEPPIGLQQPIPYDKLSGADAIIPIDAPWQTVGAIEAPLARVAPAEQQDRSVVSAAVPKVEYAIVGGSATVNCRLPEDTAVEGVEVVERDLRFETPFGSTQAFKLLRLAGAECDDGNEHLALAIRMHGWTTGENWAASRGQQQVFWVLEQAGVRKIVGNAGVGAVSALLDPGDLVLADDIIDETHSRPSALHATWPNSVNLREPFCAGLRHGLADAAAWPVQPRVPARA